MKPITPEITIMGTIDSTVYTCIKGPAAFFDTSLPMNILIANSLSSLLPPVPVASSETEALSVSISSSVDKNCVLSSGGAPDFPPATPPARSPPLSLGFPALSFLLLVLPSLPRHWDNAMQ